MTPISRTEKNARLRRYREKIGKQVAEAVAAPSAEGVSLIADKLKGKELEDALMAVASKIGLSASIRAIYAQLPAPEAAVPDLPKAIPDDSGGDQPISLAIPRKTFPNTPESRLARVYGRPLNQRQRMIEFDDDKTHGILWVQSDSPVWLGWTVWVKVNPDERQKGWILDGTYSRRGIRLK
jgi:hypothetical protein